MRLGPKCRLNFTRKTVTTDRRQFTLSYLFYFSFFFCIVFACLRFGSHFRSHDSHVTGEHMVELGGHFFLFVVFCKSKQFFNVHVHVYCIFKVTFLVQDFMDVLCDLVSQNVVKSTDIWVYKMSVRVHFYRHCSLQLNTGISSFLSKSGNAMDSAFQQ